MEKRPNFCGNSRENHYPRCPICKQQPHDEDPGFQVDVPPGIPGVQPGHYYGCVDCAVKYCPADDTTGRMASLLDDKERIDGLRKLTAAA